ncbi:BA75_01839T0 [Komagataella pastoris]|uniref:N-(5'-phosphoribosyl)anthranilate isomerase n=1 Tax=Komagataella pastoris TaxID=4922 RepID=A0A1B2J735_PICPA|nr:BA75_01839T0 [Komagataella pastoris]
MALVKICGLQSLEAAETAVDNGASLVGVIMVPGRDRTVKQEVAREISQMVRQKRMSKNSRYLDSRQLRKDWDNRPLEDWFDYNVKEINSNGPFLVGVFRNQSIEEIQQAIHTHGLDFVQLHGSEDFDSYIRNIPVPVITRYTDNAVDGLTGEDLATKRALVLLDSELGGEGKTIDWARAHEFGEHRGKYLLAGGLTPDNVAHARSHAGCIGVDVSGGVETNASKDLDKITQFIKNAI